MPESVASAVQRIRERVAAAAERAGRDAGDIRIVGAVKGVEARRIQEAVDAGITELGANQAKDLATKAEVIRGATWHYLGTIQTNKVRLLDAASVIQSLTRQREAEALERAGTARDVLIEVNVAGEQSKQGIAPEQVETLLAHLDRSPLLRTRGFMFVAPQAQNPEDVRWVFTAGRHLSERYGLHELSMGMSEDFEVAIEEGATIVRIGRAIFSPEEF